MLIRQLSAEDAEILWQARLQALCESPAAFLSTLAEAQNDSAEVMRAQLADPGTRYFGASIDGMLAGFLRYVRPMRMARRHTAEVHSVHVGAGHRGQGIARQLLLAAFAAARALYESLGFSVIGTDPRAVKRAGSYADIVSYWISLH
ncbi:GNAT family N-acetyltransferase [Stenotrophomonas maltophilia]|jgi:Acetyltransferases, including N-acetylases of ribosomal proteins|nr:GNAT family N-acetyltransferase [Stenotrophomonas maltophilia]MCI1106256.1 GNAT family N-acetyltransferase [Stenotrophomonas maltophilia]